MFRLDVKHCRNWKETCLHQQVEPLEMLCCRCGNDSTGMAKAFLCCRWMKLVRISALFKAGGYKPFKNYVSRIKEHHIMAGFGWTERMALIMARCTRSVLRGLAGSKRSEAFEWTKVFTYLRDKPHQVSHNGPLHPYPMIVTATYFMLRELEASAVDVQDVSFSANSVTLALPVSKTDWSAKGCRRTWSCLCDKSLTCPFHVLMRHVTDLRNSDMDSGPLFPNSMTLWESTARRLAWLTLLGRRPNWQVHPARMDRETGHCLDIHFGSHVQGCFRLWVWIQ